MRQGPLISQLGPFAAEAAGTTGGGALLRREGRSLEPPEGLLTVEEGVPGARAALKRRSTFVQIAPESCPSRLAAILILERCLDRRPDLSETHRHGLGEILKVLADYPEAAFGEMVEVRRSFIAPVPGVMAERIGPQGWRDWR